MKTHHLHVSSIILLLVVIALGLVYSPAGNRQSNAETSPCGSSKNLSGYAWSSNIGWIRFHGINFGSVDWPGVSLNANCELEGYAWSPNVGWIKFSPNLWPVGAEDASGAKISSPVNGNGSFSGWARACSVFTSGCPGALDDDSRLGGWDGWIRMSDTLPTAYGVNKDATGKLTGHAWGSDVIGWIKFCGDDPNQYCVKTQDLEVVCKAQLLGADIGTVALDTPFQWVASVSNGAGPYTYSWSATPISASPNFPWSNNSSVTQSYSSGGGAGAFVLVTDSELKTGRSQDCVVGLLPPDDGLTTLTIQITGDGAGSIDYPPADGAGDPPPCVHIAGATTICTAVYEETNSVDLSESHGAPVTFGGWPAACPSPFGPTCNNVAMTSDVTINVNFDDPTVGSNVTLCALQEDASFQVIAPPGGCYASGSEPVMGILYHPTGNAVNAVPVIHIGVVNADGDPVQLEVKEFSRRANSQSIETVPGGSNVSCRFGDNGSFSEDCVGLKSSAVSSGSYADLTIRVNDQSRDLLEASPFKIVIGVKNGDPADVLNLKFNYQPSNVRPR
ncbi:MAG: hypothetical protein AAB468_02110 [Patescibacteria group bacterium]